MKKEMILTLLFLGIIFIGCSSNTKDEINEITVLDKNKAEIRIDTTLMKVADLPIHIDSTSYLIHPIGYVNSREKGEDYFLKSSSKGGEKYDLTSFYGNEINGVMTNLKFQKIGTDNFISLTKENIEISSVSFLRAIFNNTKKQVLIYKVIDSDTNGDKELNYEDNTSLYLSKIDGTGFTKISPSNQEVTHTQVLAVNNRLYFKTNENVKTKEDKLQIHYFYVDFNTEGFKTVEYYPVND